MSAFPKVPGENGNEEMHANTLGLSGEGGAKKVNTQLVLAVGALVVAGGLLYGMRRFGVDAGQALTGLVLDYSVEESARTNNNARFERVVADLERSTRPYQIADDKLQTNPFSLPEALLPPVEAITDSGTVSRPTTNTRNTGPSKEDLMRAAARKEFSSFNLQSVLGGRVPIAMIDGAMVREGDQLGEHFKVLKIDGRAVRIEDALGDRYTLAMKQTGVSGDMKVQREGDDG
ncbi:MAG: hypothetical protein AAF138_10620 [Planctomycetota bacterium]